MRPGVTEASCLRRSALTLGMVLAFSTGLARSGPDFHAPDAQLEELIGILLQENPRLHASRAHAQSRDERAAQARSLPDPRLSYWYFAQTPETRVGPSEHMLALTQGVPWKGKRSLQGERAESLARGSAWEVEEQASFLVAQLKKAYFEAFYLQEALSVNGDQRQLLQRFESIALKRYATGEGIQQSVVKVQTDLTRLQDQETSVREGLDLVVRQVTELIGRPRTDLNLSSIKLGIPEVQYDREMLETDAISHQPEVQALQQKVEADGLWSRRRALDSRPDFDFGLGYTFVGDREDQAGLLLPPDDNGKDIVSLRIGFNIPIHRKRIRAGVAEANYSLFSSQELLTQSKNQVRHQVQQAVLRLNTLEERARLYDEILIPQAEESLASAEAAYTTNRLEFLDLLDAERVLFEVRLMYYRFVADYWTALAGLELALGKPFPDAGQARSTGGGDG